MEHSRCPWCARSAEETHYHDTEWGVPLLDDRKLFEFMVLDAFQAGLSWTTVLRKRENFRKAFYDFSPEAIAPMGSNQVEVLMQDTGIIRNKLKIQGTIKNAQAFLNLQEAGIPFHAFVWKFVDGTPVVNYVKPGDSVPARTEISDQMSKELKKLGFTFVGSTICYAFMQAAGLVNDHRIDCFRFQEVQQIG